MLSRKCSFVEIVLLEDGTPFSGSFNMQPLGSLAELLHKEISRLEEHHLARNQARD